MFCLLLCFTPRCPTKEQRLQLLNWRSEKKRKHQVMRRRLISRKMMCAVTDVWETSVWSTRWTYWYQDKAGLLLNPMLASTPNLPTASYCGVSTYHYSWAHSPGYNSRPAGVFLLTLLPGELPSCSIQLVLLFAGWVLTGPSNSERGWRRYSVFTAFLRQPSGLHLTTETHGHVSHLIWVIYMK